MMGDETVWPVSGQLPVQVRVREGQDYRLQIVGAGGVLLDRRIDDADVTIEALIPVTDTPYLYVRLVVDDPDDLIVVCLTNPLFLSSRR